VQSAVRTLEDYDFFFNLLKQIFEFFSSKH
jgi:hypothetical protein